MTTTAVPEPSVDDVADNLLVAALGTVQLLSIHVGDRLGWYAALAAAGPTTPTDLAARTSTQERYAREWLEQQAVYGIIRVHTAGTERAYELPQATAEVLTDSGSLAYLSPLCRMFAAVAGQLPSLLEVYRHGGGVAWGRFGVDARQAQADMNRPLFEKRLAAALAEVPGIDRVLRRPSAQILDIGCGEGWSSIALAHAYPTATVRGLDVDPPSVEAARRHALAAGIDQRVTFDVTDAAEIGEHGSFDAVFAFECVHDMPRPAEVLAAVRQAVRDDGVVVVMDERVADEFTAPGDPVEQLMYGFSLFVCLPDGLSSTPSVGTGTVMRTSALTEIAQRAGFAGADVLPIEDFGFFRFYQLSH